MRFSVFNITRRRYVYANVYLHSYTVSILTVNFVINTYMYVT